MTAKFRGRRASRSGAPSLRMELGDAHVMHVNGADTLAAWLTAG